jgi:hypothetical protein
MTINQFDLPPGMDVEAIPRRFSDRDLLAIFAAMWMPVHGYSGDVDSGARICFDRAEAMLSELNRRTQ